MAEASKKQKQEGTYLCPLRLLKQSAVIGCFINDSNLFLIALDTGQSLIGFLLDSVHEGFWCPSVVEMVSIYPSMVEIALQSLTYKYKNTDPICEVSVVMIYSSLRGLTAQLTCLKDSFSTCESLGNSNIQHIIDHRWKFYT